MMYTDRVRVGIGTKLIDYHPMTIIAKILSTAFG